MSIIYRYGVSMLSRKNHIKALPEELMIDKETGQILLKQENGKIVSYDAMTRFKASVDNIRFTAEKQLCMGKIVSIVPENTALPKCVTSDEPILVEETVELGPIKKLLIQLDVDVVDTTSTFGDIKSYDKVLAEVIINRNGQQTVIKEPVLQLADKIITFDTAELTSITSIKIINEDVLDDAESQYILQNILLLTV